MVYFYQLVEVYCFGIFYQTLGFRHTNSRYYRAY